MQTSSRVASGPFKNLNYVEQSVGGALVPKLLGVYEKELHPYLEKIVDLNVDLMIHIGAAEGYYVAGMARLMPCAQSLAFEQNADGREIMKRVLQANGVAMKNVSIQERCRVSDLRDRVPQDCRAFILCDVEGYEVVLLDPLRLPFLRNAYILVELHDFKVDGISEELRRRFHQTHSIRMIRQQDREPSDWPLRSTFRAWLPRSVFRWAMSERRPVHMSWYWMEPKPATGDPPPTMPPASRVDMNSKWSRSCECVDG
jgi:hypothetical protein